MIHITVRQVNIALKTLVSKYFIYTLQITI